MKILEYFFTFLDVTLSQKLYFLLLSLSAYIDYTLSYILSSLATSWFLLMSTFGVEAVVMSIKFLISVALLIFIRGSIPRYRFDHLTRIGWVKFLTLVVCFLLIELVFLYTLMS